jgi:predicted dehydrogenase
MGRRHAANARALGHEVGVHDIDNDRRWQAFSSGYVLENDRWLVDVDAIVVATPASQHVEAMRDWLATPMLVEKPIVASVADAKSLSPRLEHVWVGYNWRHHAEIVAARTRCSLPDRLTLGCDTRMAKWPGRDYAEPILELSHEIDLLNYWRGRMPQLMSARMLSNHAIALSFDTGDAVYLDWDAEPCRTVGIELGNSMEVFYPSLGETLEQSYRDEMEAFLSWVAAGYHVPAGCTLEDGLAVLRICEQAKAMAGVSA